MGIVKQKIRVICLLWIYKRRDSAKLAMMNTFDIFSVTTQTINVSCLLKGIKNIYLKL